MKDRVDPELVKQIDEAAPDAKVGAVIRIASPSPGSLAPTPEETERIASDLVDRMRKRENSRAPDFVADFNVFRNLGYFVVSATPAQLKALVDQPEVESAIPNRPRREED